MRTNLLLGLLVVGGCHRGSFGLLDRDRMCWAVDFPEPVGVNYADCERATENEPNYIDPDGNCWRGPNCDIRTWLGWRFPTLPGDEFCDEAVTSAYYACPEDTD